MEYWKLKFPPGQEPCNTSRLHDSISFSTALVIMPLLIRNETGQERGDLWKKVKYNGQNDQRNEEGHDPLEDDVKGDFRSDAFNDEDVDPDRRRDDAHLPGQDDDHSKPDGIKAQFLNNGVEDRDGDYDQGHGIHKETADKVNEYNNGHNGHPVDRKVPYPVCQYEWDSRHGHEVTKDHSARDNG